MVSTGINGFGRFGLHLLKYWLDRKSAANFSIDYINDDFLSPDAIHAIILNDRFVKITANHSVMIEKDHISFTDKDGAVTTIGLSNCDKEQMPWRGKPQYLLECSGKHSKAALNRDYLEGDTVKIIISATVADADQTLIYGFNHAEYRAKAPA